MFSHSSPLLWPLASCEVASSYQPTGRRSTAITWSPSLTWTSVVPDSLAGHQLPDSRWSLAGRGLAANRQLASQWLAGQRPEASEWLVISWRLSSGHNDRLAVSCKRVASHQSAASRNWCPARGSPRPTASCRLAVSQRPASGHHSAGGWRSSIGEPSVDDQPAAGGHLAPNQRHWAALKIIRR